MIIYYDRQYKHFADLKPQDIDLRYFEGVVNFILKQKDETVTDITKFNNKDKFIEYVVYFIDWTYYSQVLPKCSFNNAFTNLTIVPYKKPKNEILFF